MPHRAIDPHAVDAARAAMPSSAEAARLDTNAEILCSPIRVKILRALLRAELAAGDLALVLGRSRSATSQHLRILRDAGLVETRRQRNVVRYRLSRNVSAATLADVAMKLDAA